MKSVTVPGAEKISSGFTDFLQNWFPSVFTGGLGIFLLGLWLGWFGHSFALAEKSILTVGWVVTSVILRLGTRSLRHVWLTDREILVEERGRKVGIPLEDVMEVKESRGRKVKTIRLVLRRASPLGDEVRFVPVWRGHFPFSDHPVVKEIQQKKRMLAGDSGEGRPRLS
jgi:hypothetical protein